MSEFVNIHTHQKSINEEAIEIISLFHNASIPDEGYFSIGAHPWHAEKNSSQSMLEEIIPKARFAFAIGECGLDRSSSIDWNKQMDVFRKQIELSEKIRKPLIIHAVRSYPDIIALNKYYKPKQAWIIHGFNGNTEQVKQLLNYNIYLSYGINILRLNNNEINCLSETPLDRLFLETDDSNINIVEMYDFASKQLNLKTDVLKNQLYSNFKKIKE
jgi:TatD DNase family protein